MMVVEFSQIRSTLIIYSDVILQIKLYTQTLDSSSHIICETGKHLIFNNKDKFNILKPILFINHFCRNNIQRDM